MGGNMSQTAADLKSGVRETRDNGTEVATYSLDQLRIDHDAEDASGSASCIGHRGRDVRR